MILLCGPITHNKDPFLKYFSASTLEKLVIKVISFGHCELAACLPCLLFQEAVSALLLAAFSNVFPALRHTQRWIQHLHKFILYNYVC